MLVGDNEQCDRNNLSNFLGQTCQTLGYDYGRLRCTSDCRFDFDGCGTVEDGYGAAPNPVLVTDNVCGNFMTESGEVCDRGNIGSMPPACTSYGYAGGTGYSGLAFNCRDDCLGFDSRDCYGNVGNPTATTPPAGDTTYEALCGNYFPDSGIGEHCERAYSGDGTSRIFVEGSDGYVVETCAGRGYTGGTIRCSSDCETVDTSGCYGAPRAPYGTISDPPDDPDYVGRCGNRFWDEGEECEIADIYIATPEDSDAWCPDYGFSGSGGTLRCLSCDLNTDRCYGGPEGDRLGQHCGDGVIQSADGEECDGSTLGGATCSSRGFDTGTLRCRPYECRYDTYSCWNSPADYGTP